MRRRKKRREKWVSTGTDYVGRQRVSHDEYHRIMASRLAAFDDLPEADKAVLREEGISAETLRKRKRQQYIDDQRRQRIAEIEAHRRGEG